MDELADQDGVDEILGRCPCCDVEILPARLLAEYRTADGWPRIFAECPACADVVQPR